MNFVLDVYQVSKLFPNAELFGIINQLRRAAVSIPSNIAEGASRSSSKERRRYYEIARSSLVELDTHLEIANSLGYLTTNHLNHLSKSVNRIFARLTKLIQKTT
jgi:four helix bundle protein